MSAPAGKVSLTGIKPTGEPHLGNYVGAIKPALKLAQECEALYFIADYHALTTVRDPELLRHYTRSVAAAWIAAGLDPDRVIFYRQSDIPEIFELTWVMACMTPKGLMNRAHAYKAARDRNQEAGRTDPDAGINMPPKDPNSSAVFQILEQFAAPKLTAGTRQRLEAGGMGWGELKDQLFEVLNTQLAPLRTRYDGLMEPDSGLDGLLAAGAEKARKRALPVLAQVRRAIGTD